METMTIDNNSTPPSPSSPSLLSCIQSLVQLEQSLTITLEKTKPILSLPTPKSLPQAQKILALARTYSTRTSAPPGWNPSLPVVHFATPSPYPHQLRGGALGAMQLKMVKEERMLKKRRRMEELEEEEARLKKKEMDIAIAKKKRGETDEMVLSKNGKNKQHLSQQQQQQQMERKKKLEVSMNLSSSEDESESESESEEED